MRRAVVALSVLIVAVVLNSAIYAEKRVALVIGNDAYQSLLTLKKAVNDARTVAAAPEEIELKVFRGENPTRRFGFEPEMVRIPGGVSPMGCVSGWDCIDDEKPVHRVTVGTFF